MVRRMREAFLRRDFDQSLAAFHPDIEWDGTNLPDGTISRGHQAIIDHSARWFGMWEDWTIELEEFVDVGDDVVVFIRERGRSKTGIDMDERHAEVYTLNDGRIVRRRGFSDAGPSARSCRAAGVGIEVSRPGDLSRADLAVTVGRL